MDGIEIFNSYELSEKSLEKSSYIYLQTFNLHVSYSFFGRYKKYMSFILLTKELPTIMSRTKLSICPTKFIVKLIEY